MKKNFFLPFICLLFSANIFGQNNLVRAFQPANVVNKIPYGANEKVGKYVQSDDAKIYYEVYGKGEPIVLLHGGLFGSTIEMTDFIDNLKNNYKVIAISTRGHGKSEIGNKPLSLEQRSNDVLAVINAVTKDSVIIIGFSDGGFTAYKFGSLFPERVKKMVVIGAGIIYPGLLVFNITSKIAYSMDSAYWKQQLKLMPEPERIEEVFTQVNKCYTNLVVEKEILSSIKCPVLVMAGDRDHGNTVENIVKVARLIPNSQLSIVPNCTHTVFNEHFEAVWVQVSRFIKSK